MLAGPYPLDGIGTRILALLPFLLLPLLSLSLSLLLSSFILNNPLLLWSWPWPFLCGPTGRD